MKIIIPLIVLGIVFVSACTQISDDVKQQAINVCVESCKAATQDLTNGPCLLNPIQELSDWVCDVAHSPREPVDDLPENQCSAFREGTAKHFVEVDLTCTLIQAR